jgi:hypothetical protein
MEKEQNVIFGQEFVEKQNDTIKKVVNTSIVGWDGERQVEDIRHQKIAWDVCDNKVHLLVWGHLQK